LKGHGMVLLQPGQVIIGRKCISSDLKIGEQVVRRCLKKLENIEISTSEPTNAGTILTICNWSTYQADDEATNQQTNQRPTSIQPASNQHPTTTQEVNQESIEALKQKPELTHPFDAFWSLYDKKVDPERCKRYWSGQSKLESGSRMTDADRAAVMAVLPQYIAATPDKQYRKGPASYLYKSAWLDEIIRREDGTNRGPAPTRRRLACEEAGVKWPEGESHEL